MMAPGIDIEDQLFAASLAAEMRSLEKHQKLGFKVTVLNFLHETLTHKNDEMQNYTDSMD